MKTICISCVLLFLAFAAVAGHAAETNSPPRVGALRQYDRYVFEGNNTFSNRTLWVGLNSTFAFPQVSHPAAPRGPFLDAIRDDLQLGYQHNGFPNAGVSATCDSARDDVVVKINEGPRYFCGPVEVSGLGKSLARSVVKTLTDTNADAPDFSDSFQFIDDAPAAWISNSVFNTSSANGSFWAPGQPATFDAITLQNLAAGVSNVLATSGYLSARIQLSIVTNLAAGAATLHVSIADKGPLATIGNIDVQGNQRTSREVLLNYLGIKPGMKLDAAVVADINNKLYHSGRFMTCSLAFGTPDSAGRVPLSLQVQENDKSPPLDKPFSLKEQTLLRVRDWFSKLGDNGCEAVLDISGYPDAATLLECDFSPRHGWLFLDQVNTSGTNQLRHALALASDRLAYYVPGQKVKFLASLPKTSFITYLTLLTTAPDEQGNCVSFTCGAGFTNADNLAEPAPCILAMRLDPAAFVRLAYDTNASYWFDGNQLIESNSSMVAKFDSQTGRLIEMASPRSGPNAVAINLRFEPDTLAARLKQIVQDGADFENVYQTNAPFCSALTFFGGELLQEKTLYSALQTKLPSALCAELPRLFDENKFRAAFSIFDDWSSFKSRVDRPEEEAFEIPQTVDWSGQNGTTAMIAALGQQILLYDDCILPPQSWPWIMSRDAVFFARGQNEYLSQDVAEIENSPQTGPLGFLALAEALQYLHLPAAKSVAAHGLQRLSTADFRRDYRLFLDPHYFAGRYISSWQTLLTTLDDQDLNALADSLPPAPAECIRNCAQRLRAAKTDAPLVETLSPALDSLWENQLKNQVSDRLKEIAGQ